MLKMKLDRMKRFAAFENDEHDKRIEKGQHLVSSVDKNHYKAGEPTGVAAHLAEE